MRQLAVFLLFLLFLGLGVAMNGAGRYRDIYRSICDLTEQHFYKADRKLDNWVADCRWNAAHLPRPRDSGAFLRIVQDQLDALGVSHFQVYDPGEDRRLWKGESLDTGIRARYVEDHLVIYRVLDGSPADDVGLRAGDEVLKIEGTEQVTPWGAMRRSGRFRLRRGGEEFESAVTARDFVEDQHPRLADLGRGAGWLDLPSFRAEFFGAEDWRALAARLAGFRHVVVDLRENSGGNFVAMLRAASAFHCAEESLGDLRQPRKFLPPKDGFADDLSDARQLDDLERYGDIGLRAFPGYPCFRGRVTVLVSPETSSVAEIFAESFLDGAGGRSRVWGQPTSGDVVLAVWYDLPALGPGFSISIPEAVYRTPQDEELENVGVYPTRELFYDLPSALKGRDSWLDKAAVW